MDMNITPAGAGMPRIIGPAGGDMSGFSGPDFSSQWRLITNTVPPDCNPSHNREMVNALSSHAPSLHIHSATPRRNHLTAKPLKVGDEHGHGAPHSPSAHIHSNNLFASIDHKPHSPVSQIGNSSHQNLFDALPAIENE
eukprot:Gb_01087 [translate_table: standard]